MQFSSKNVIMLLYIAVIFQNFPESPITNTEREMKEKIENVLQGMYQLEIK